MMLTEIEKLILKGTGDAHPADAAALKARRATDRNAVAQATDDLIMRGLLDNDGYPTADGIRAAWS